MSQQWRTVGTTGSVLTGTRFEPQTYRSTGECVTAQPTGQYCEMCICGNGSYSMEKNNNQALVPNVYKTQTHLQTLCLHLFLPLIQHHLQYAYYCYRGTFFYQVSID